MTRPTLRDGHVVSPCPSGDALLADVASVRTQLARMVWVRSALESLGLGLASWLVLTSCHAAMPVRWPLASWMMVSLSVAVAVVLLMARRRRAGTISLLRAALWIEEHGGTGFALVTWVEQWSTGDGASSTLGAVVERASRAAMTQAQRALPRLAREQLQGPALFAGGALLLTMLAWSTGTNAVRAPNGSAANGGVAQTARDAAIARWDVQITPPAYAGQTARRLGDIATIRVLSGTRIDVIGTDAPPDSVTVRVLGEGADSSLRAAPPRASASSASSAESSASAPSAFAPSAFAPSAFAPSATIQSSGSGWTATLVATNDPLAVRVHRSRFARLLLVEGVQDSLPRVSLQLPLRDSVLRRPEGRVPLEATLHDDLGLASASFDVVVSRGEGERFTVTTAHVGARRFDAMRDATSRGASVQDATLRASLDLAAMSLGPGDIVHVRAVARDKHPLASREAGVSETRSFRIARPSEYDSVAVEPAPPPEVDKSLMSQRMLLMLTERLLSRRPRLTTPVYRDESQQLAREQARLRQAVGDAVFQRLSGEGGGEDSHSAGDGRDHGIDTVGGKLAMSGVNAEGMLEEGDDAPVLAINKPLLEAYNAMWDAGRALEQAELRTAIPFMRVALAAIERARAASRLYLRGSPPAVIVDLAKVRLTGKDTGTANDRAARVALPARSALRETRLLAAASRLTSDAMAARDSIAVLRMESLADAPAFAAALWSLLEDIRRATGRRGGGAVDVTEALVRARRVLGGIERVPAGAWSRGGPP